MAAPFRGSVVAVTGASAGVGRAVARAFGAAAARVALLARSRRALDAAAAELAAAGGAALVLPLDVSDAGALDAAADRIAEAWGGIDVWVNDAMVSVVAPAGEIRPAEYRRVTEVNSLGAVTAPSRRSAGCDGRGGAVLGTFYRP